MMTGRHSMHGDNLPGTPWNPPDDQPKPDGGPPPGEGKHRKEDDEKDDG